MNKTKLQTLKGFRDFLPDKMAIRNEVIKRLRDVFEKYGFTELQTPSLEYQEVLIGKYGEEAEKLMYLFKDPGGRSVGLRYDLTVPLARVISQYPRLPKPFKRYQIQPAWRAEKPQRGRYREFFQCDVDIVDSSSPLADAEIIAIISDSLKTLELPVFRIRVNSRRVLFAAMEAAGIPKDKWPTAIQSIDKLDKKPKEEVEKELLKKSFKNEQIKKVFKAISEARPDNFLKQTIEYAENLGTKNLEFDSTLARGLDYYTGPIFEAAVEKPKIGSIAGGGRYDKLLKTLGGPDLPATGTSIGLDRISDVIEELDLWPELAKTPVQILVTIFSPKLVVRSIKVANLLRSNDLNADLYPADDVKLDKQLKYADKKKIPWVIIIGPQEARENSAVLKNLRTGKQEKIPVDKLPSKIK